MRSAVGGILTVLLALACLTIVIGSLAEYAACSGCRDHLERSFWGSMLLGSGIVTLLNVAIRLV